MEKRTIQMLVLLAVSVFIVFASYTFFATNSTQAHDTLNCNTNGIIEQFQGIAADRQCPQVLVDAKELLVGNPRRDGIPAIDDPIFVSAIETSFSDDEYIIGVNINNDIRAYPYSILNWHEIVNDVVGGVPVAVTYCPLCETNTVFVREVNGTTTTFGTSGALYHSCLVMYDRLTESLWVQPWGLGITGKGYNQNLERIEGVRTTLGAWKALHPDTKVLSIETGYDREYQAYPYGSYYTDETLLFPVRNQNTLRAHPKEISFIAFSDAGAPAFNYFSGDSTVVTLADMREQKQLTKTVGGETVHFSYDAVLDTVTATTAGGKPVPLMAAFGFIMPAFFE